MANFKVVNDFTDLEDNNTRYKAGDEYPKRDHKPSKKRIDELSGVHPKYKRVFIEEVKEETKAKKTKSKE
ncbi:hypothetical protein M4D56_01915 [Cytobacillus oceanisediminis]|uniref:hypothetical protein n=1 Tax=Cytobacillus oceanisediminis TaxID=665099 RepID=UPI00203B96E6|nr:hypothetical protein [Cytobacillus oceanisediminis]MCM3527851.1 hypothetical protein [Cytobacillus oceanisediminis]